MEDYSLLGFKANGKDQEILYPTQKNYTIPNLNTKDLTSKIIKTAS